MMFSLLKDVLSELYSSLWLIAFLFAFNIVVLQLSMTPSEKTFLGCDPPVENRCFMSVSLRQA